jgi:cell division protein FtsZ
MGIGSARGADRAIKAAELAVESPLLEASIEGAHGVLLSIQGGSNLGIFEIHDAADLVKEAAHPEANIIFGTVIDDTLGDEVRVTVIAAGFDSGEPSLRLDPTFLSRPEPLPEQTVAEEKSIEVPVVEEKREPVAPISATSSYEPAFADDNDLDIPEFLK